jgi:hypothetical protein
MRYIIILSILFLAGCDSGSFDKDKRQILAKNVLHSQLPPHATDFDIISFKEDTVPQLDSNFKRAIRYTMNFEYTDSTKTLQTATGEIFFAPDGHSVIRSVITNSSAK